MGAVIWQKVTTTNTTGGASIMGSFPYPRNGILKLDYEFILIFKKIGVSPKPTAEQKEKSKLTIEEWNQYFTGHWNFNGEKQEGHLAMFPEELPKRLIKMFSFAGDTILDPFLGSGTTILAAKNLDRNSVGYEVNAEFLPFIKKKLGIEQNAIFKTPIFNISEQKQMSRDYKKRILELPYVFEDPVQFDKKIDPRKLKFGSKIDKSVNNNSNYYTVKDIICPEILILNNGMKVRMIGIKSIQEKFAQAIDYLQHKILNQKVLIKFDAVKYDNEGNLFCYIYLKNKTFINAHLVKLGLTGINIDYDYKFKSKFQEYYWETIDGKRMAAKQCNE